MPNPPGFTSQQVRALFRAEEDLKQKLLLAKLELEAALAQRAHRAARLHWIQTPRSTKDVGQGHPLAHPSEGSPNIAELAQRVATTQRELSAAALRTHIPNDSSPIPRALEVIQDHQTVAALPQPLSPTTAGPPGGAVQLAAGDADSKQPPVLTATPDDDETPPARAPPGTIRVTIDQLWHDCALAWDGQFYDWQQFQDYYGAAADGYWLGAEHYCHGSSAQQQHAGSSSSGQQQQAVHDFQPARAGNLIQKQPCSSADSATS